MAGTVITNKGLILITKLLAAGATLEFTRVAVGTGSIPSGYDPHNMAALASYRMDGAISGYGVDPDHNDIAFVVMQISSIGIESGFAITEAGVFAKDPNEGEILYAYLDLTEDPQYIYAEGEAISKFAEITLNVLIGEIQSVTAIISPNALVRNSEFNAALARINENIDSLHKIRQVLIPESGWSNEYPYINTVLLEGLSADANLKVIGIYLPSDASESDVKAANKALNFLIYNENGVSEGSVTFKAYKKPTIDLTVITEGG